MRFNHFAIKLYYVLHFYVYFSSISSIDEQANFSYINPKMQTRHNIDKRKVIAKL